MQTPNLSSAQRAWMKDPEGFRRRMEQRAQELWMDGYGVLPGLELGVFLVGTPKEEEYPVNALANTCGCAYALKAEIPQVCCKHLTGIGPLVAEQLSFYKVAAEQHELAGRPERAAARWAQYNALLKHWEDAKDARDCMEYELSHPDPPEPCGMRQCKGCSRWFLAVKPGTEVCKTCWESFGEWAGKNPEPLPEPEEQDPFEEEPEPIYCAGCRNADAEPGDVFCSACNEEMRAAQEELGDWTIDERDDYAPHRRGNKWIWLE